MSHSRVISMTFAYVLLLTLLSCSGENNNDLGSEYSDNNQDNITIEKSARPTLKFKDNVRLKMDLSSSLAIEENQLCNELGRLSCLDDVHKLVLGGTSPYDEGRYEAIDRFTVSGPIAAQRVMSSACISRVDADIANPESFVLFNQSKSLEESIEILYTSLLKRFPSSRETQVLNDLFLEIDEISENTWRDWSISACIALSTSTEFLFY